MSEHELKHVIALLLEDAKRLQQIEPNACTEARIGIAQTTLGSFEEGHQVEKCSLTISPQLQRLKKIISELEIASNDSEAHEKFLLELKLIESELK